MSDILEQSIRQAVRRPEVVEAMAKALEAQLRRELANMAGGSDLYVNKYHHDKALRNTRIKASFNGSNYDQIARAEGLTPRQVRRIINGVPVHKPKK